MRIECDRSTPAKDLIAASDRLELELYNRGYIRCDRCDEWTVSPIVTDRHDPFHKQYPQVCMGCYEGLSIGSML